MLVVTIADASSAWPPAVEHTLQVAGSHRVELERVLDHFQAAGDPQQREAAQWLIAHMEGHGHIVAGFFTKDKTEVSFDALDYPDFASAQAALDRLEKKRGALDYGKSRWIEDCQTLSAELLIENIEQAFQAWRSDPWAKEMSYETFRDYVLPYRGSEEPAESFRPWMRQRFADLAAGMKDASDPREAAARIRSDVDRLIGFNELYYLHPTDQSLSEMLQRKLGRCEDITNMVMYAWRANGIAAASDYTPAWADRDNNHAWEVILDDTGRGSTGLASRAAKVYRKMFSRQPQALGSLLHSDESAPRWLTGKNYADVTDQYQPVSDLTIELSQPPTVGERFAYLCVFNGGEWTAIHHGALEPSGRVTFTKMGRNIAYLPAYFRDEVLQPAGAPVLLTATGSVVTLDGNDSSTITVEMSTTRPEVHDADTRRVIPVVPVEAGGIYQLQSWDPNVGGWHPHGEKEAGDSPVSFGQLPAGRLYWLTAKEGRKLERIFTIDSGQPTWY